MSVYNARLGSLAGGGTKKVTKRELSSKDLQIADAMLTNQERFE